MNLNEHNRIKLEKILLEDLTPEFAHAIPYLVERTRQGIRCTKAGTANYDIPGLSRVGGDPDLPPQLEWPLTTDGVPMTFLVQLNLQDLAQHDEASLLPTCGMLYFFGGEAESAFNIQHRVLFVADDELASVQRRLSPAATALKEQFHGYQLETRATLEPPNHAYVDYDQFLQNEIDDDEDYEVQIMEDYESLCNTISDCQYEDVIQMFGYPTEEEQHDDSEYAAALMMLTGATYNYDKNEALQQLANYFAGNEEKAKQEIEDTIMLLEIDLNDDDTGFGWPGILHFFIRKEDLLAGRFDRTYCSLYSS
ncbi:DUF1963 domain-containing protein [Paenibacillus elgii]